MPAPKKQFCPRGHDTFIVGRRKSGMCAECDANRVTVWRWGNPEFRQRDNIRRLAAKKAKPTTITIAATILGAGLAWSEPLTAHVELSDGYREDLYAQTVEDCRAIAALAVQGRACAAAGLACGLQFAGHANATLTRLTCDPKSPLPVEDCIKNYDCKTH